MEYVRVTYSTVMVRESFSKEVTDRPLFKTGYSIAFNLYANVMIYDNLKTRTNVGTIII